MTKDQAGILLCVCCVCAAPMPFGRKNTHLCDCTKEWRKTTHDASQNGGKFHRKWLKLWLSLSVGWKTKSVQGIYSQWKRRNVSHFALQNALTVNLWVVYFARMPLEIAPRVWHSLNTHNSIIGDAEATIATAIRDKRMKQTNRWHFILFQFFFPGTTTMYIEHSEPPNRTLTLARSFVRSQQWIA